MSGQSRAAVYDPTLDVDTNTKGTGAPFERWEGDHTAVVHVLWHAEHEGWIARRPSAERPLRRAIYDRLFNPDTSEGPRPSYSDVVADLRAILDEFDPANGGIDGHNLTPDETPALHENDGLDMTASALGRSRAVAAIKAYERALALRTAAHYFRDLSAEQIDRRKVIDILERLAGEQIGTPATSTPRPN